jgi:hypothetical protein
MAVAPSREERDVGNRTRSTLPMVPNGEGARKDPKCREQSQSGSPATLLLLVAKDVFPAVLLVSDGPLLCVYRIEMYDVALGEPKLVTRVLRIDRSSSACDACV